MATTSSRSVMTNRRQEIQIVSDEHTEIFMIINHEIINASIGLCGLVANSINIVIFYKQGFKNTMNITFFGLAMSDMCSLIAVLWLIVCVNPLFVKSDVDMMPLEILHLTAGITHICFVRITGWITVFVTAERCLCIALPLRIKQIITPKVTMATVLFIYISIMLSFVPEFETSYIDWKFYPDRNRTLLGLVFTSNRKSKEGVVFFLFSILGTASFVVVIVLTVILVVKLKQATEWRRKAHVDKERSQTVSNRDRKSMNMVVVISSVLIVCFTPGVVISMTSFFKPEFSVLGTQLNAFYVAWSFAFIFESINASVPIFLYYRMSSKYRETFQQVFPCCMTKENNVRK